jgi:flagellar basal body-associated protein FliL
MAETSSHPSLLMESKGPPFHYWQFHLNEIPFIPSERTIDYSTNINHSTEPMLEDPVTAPNFLSDLIQGHGLIYICFTLLFILLLIVIIALAIKIVCLYKRMKQIKNTRPDKNTTPAENMELITHDTSINPDLYFSWIMPTLKKYSVTPSDEYVEMSPFKYNMEPITPNISTNPDMNISNPDMNISFTMPNVKTTNVSTYEIPRNLTLENMELITQDISINPDMNISFTMPKAKTTNVSTYEIPQNSAHPSDE